MNKFIENYKFMMKTKYLSLTLIYWQFFFLWNMFINIKLVYFRIFTIFFDVDSENVPTQIYDYERRICSQTQYVFIMDTFYMSQINPKRCSTILHTQFNHHTLPVTPLKYTPWHWLGNPRAFSWRTWSTIWTWRRVYSSPWFRFAKFYWFIQLLLPRYTLRRYSRSWSLSMSPDSKKI